MKRQNLLKSTLCLLMAMVCNVAWAQVAFTFTRGDGMAATVTAPEGLAAELEANVDWLTNGAMGSNAGVLCPNKNTKDATVENPVTFTLTVSGLTPNQDFSSVRFTHKAVNSAGNFQPQGADVRHCNLTLTVGGEEVGTLTDENIWIPSGSTDKVIAFGNTFAADAEGNLTLGLKIAKGTNNNGCFYGLTKIELFDANPIVTFTNVQQDGTEFSLYIDESNQLAISSEPASELGAAAQFRATMQADGTYTFYNESKGLYMIWKGGSGGYNSNSGVLAEYNATYCNWQVIQANETAKGTFYFVGKRSNGKDGTLIILGETGKFDAWGNTAGLSDKYSNLYRIESATPIKYTLTDSQSGGQFTGTGTSLEPMADGVTLSGKKLEGKDFTADATFPFPVSKPGEEDWTFIRSYAMTDGKCYFHVDDAYTKVITKSPIAANGMTYLPTADKIAKWQWAIYPVIDNGKIVFTIKNRAADKFVGGTAAANSVPLAETGSKFCWGACIGNGKGFYLADKSNVFFAANSSGSGDKDAILWTKSGSAHQGGNLEFPEASYTVTTDAAGYATLYTPMAVTAPSGVAAYTGRLNATNTLLSLDEVNTTIPANTAVLLIGAASTTYTFVESGDVVAGIEGNVFQGSDASVDVASIEGSVYTYEYRDGDVVFAKVTEGSVPGYTAYVAVQSEAEVIITDIFKAAAKAAVAEYAAKLKNQPGYYYCTVGETKIYSAEEVNALIDATETKEAAAGIVEAVKVQTLVVPEAGKYYRIAYDYGNSGGVKYLQSTYHSGSKLAFTANKDEASLFCVEQVGENLRLKSYTTGKYLKEDGGSRGLHDTGGNVAFSAGGSIGKIKIQATSYLHANGSNDDCYLDHCSGDGCAQHNLIVEEVAVYRFTVNGESKVGASATWNGETKALPATWAIFDGITITNPTLSINCPASYTFTGLVEGTTALGNTVEIASLEADRTITAGFSQAFFSESYGEKWVRLQNCSNTEYWATMENVTANGKGKTAKLDYADEKQLWCLVGTAESFVVYNKAAGENLALNVPLAGNATAYADGNQAMLTADKGTWKLIEQDFGYALVPTVTFANNTMGINMYAGAGGYLKLYGTAESNKGSYWVIEMADVDNPLTLNVEVDKVWESSPRVAELTFTVNGKASTTRILGDVEGQKLYLPAGATYSVSSMTYRGYTYNECTNVDGVLTASYTANEERTLFYTPRDNHPYRIPAIATAPNGDIFAICDYRPCGGDIGNGDVDIVCRISSDNGVTWGNEIVLANGDGGSTNRMETGYGDPAVVVDRESNKILVMMVAGRTVCGESRWDASKIGVKDASLVNRAARIYGTYNETTSEWEWTQPEEVTDDIYKLFLDEDNNATVTSYFIGSGKICQSRVVKKGEYYRLYCSLWTRDNGNRVIYSDDFGGSWNVLGTIADRPAPNGNEPKCEELPDGTVILSSRVAGGRYFNIFTFDDETYTTGKWGTVANSTTVRDGSNQGTNGEIYKVKAIRKEDGQICDVMLQSVPAGPARTNVTVWYKEMDYTTDYTPATFAADWKVGKQVSDAESAYSTMILQADGRIGFFFEEAPGGYTMVYIPYTLDELTDGKYSLYTVNSTITDAGIGTFYATEAMQIPEGVKAYVADSDPEGDVITMKRLEGIIPARTGAVLRGEASDYKFIPSISYGAPVTGNLLVGHEAAKSGDAEENRKSVVIAEAGNATIYVLAKGDDGNAMFYRKEADFTVKNNKAYLQVPQVLAKGLRVRFAGEGTTEIENSEFTIQNSAVVYDLQGRRVLNPGKGVYIVGGRKVVIK